MSTRRKPKRERQVYLALSPKDREKLERLAAEQNRNLSDQLRHLIRTAADQEAQAA